MGEAMIEVVRRPRTYRDRRWLEGWSEVVGAIGHKPFARLHKGQAEFLITMYKFKARGPQGLTAREAGIVDALLDSVGC